MPRFYLGMYDVRPLFTVEDSVIQNLTIYLRFLNEKLKESDVSTNSVTEQAALQELKEHLLPRIEKTEALLAYIS